MSSLLWLVVLIVVLIAVFPRWGYSRGWGYGPSGIVVIIAIVLLLFVATGRL